MKSILRQLSRGLIPGLLMMHTAEAQTKYPVVQKVQLHFSVVSHHNTIASRVSFYNANGGNTNYAVPFLVCDPVVSLYNPYPQAITISRLRLKISDPPVGFRFKKNNAYLRQDYINGTYLGLARFQISNESNSSARKTFTLLLRDRTTAGVPGASITLQPGETKRFSPWVESNWTWQYENPSDYTSRSFNDWDTSKNFTNQDPRTTNTFGVECLPGTDFRAGFQWDHLATSNRLAATIYSFEATSYALNGWVAIKTVDSFGVEARPQRVFSTSSEPDYRISVLYGLYGNPVQDLRQDFPFSLTGLDTSELPAGNVINRTYLCQNIIQSGSTTTIGGKNIFATLTAAAKPEVLTSGNLESNLSVSGNSCYRLSFAETLDFNSALLSGDTRLGPVVDRPTILHSVKKGNTFRLFMAAPTGTANWKVMGGTSPDNLNTDLTAQSTIIEAPAMHLTNQSRLITVDTTGLGPRYFLRVEKAD